jgi:hypothetical protein
MKAVLRCTACYRGQCHSLSLTTGSFVQRRMPATNNNNNDNKPYGHGYPRARSILKILDVPY